MLHSAKYFFECVPCNGVFHCVIKEIYTISVLLQSLGTHPQVGTLWFIVNVHSWLGFIHWTNSSTKNDGNPLPSVSNTWWWRLMTLRPKGFWGGWICEDWAVTGRRRGAHNSSISKLKAETDRHFKKGQQQDGRLSMKMCCFGSVSSPLVSFIQYMDRWAPDNDSRTLWVSMRERSQWQDT